MFKLRKNVAATYSYWRQARLLRSLGTNIDILTYMNDLNLNYLKRTLPRSHLAKLTMGCDFDHWRPLDKNRCRQALGLPADRLIFFGSSRFDREKQVIPFLQTLCDLSGQHDFLYVLSGHGEPEFETKLREVASPLLEKGMLKLTGYLNDSQLLQYYSAADMFVLTSTNEGASVAVMKALACEVPVFATDTGNTSELLKEHSVGEIVPVSDFSEWRRRLEHILAGELPKPLSRHIAMQYYHWPNVARRFLGFYDDLKIISAESGPTVVDSEVVRFDPDHNQLNYESVKG